MAISSERFQAIRAFLRAADAGSFSEAARQLGQSRSTVAKAVLRLEERLRVRLFQRTTRSLALTDEGQIFRESCLRSLEELERAEARLTEHATMPVGRIRIALPVLFGRDRVMPTLLDLMAQHEGLDLDALFSNRATDLFEDRIDLAVRIGELPDTIGLTARKCGVQRIITCATSAYLDQHGRPGAPDDLAHHQCISILRQDHVEHWRLHVEGRTVNFPVSGRTRLGHVEAALLAMRSGVGIAQLPYWLVEPAIALGEVELILSAYEPFGLPVHIVWPSSSIMSPRLRITIDAIHSSISNALATPAGKQ